MIGALRIAMRVAIVLCLLLAALVLAADTQEYPGLTRAGMKALAYGALPLFLAGVLNLWAFQHDGRRGPMLTAVAVDLLILGKALTMVRVGSPPLGWMMMSVAALLVAAGAGLVFLPRPARR